MLNDITFGQFYPSDSTVHKMDPRFKLVITFAFIIVLFMIVNEFNRFFYLLGLLPGCSRLR